MIAVISDCHIDDLGSNTDPIKLNRKLIDKSVTQLILNGDIGELSLRPPHKAFPALKEWFRTALEGTQVERVYWIIGNHDYHILVRYLYEQYDYQARPRKYTLECRINDGEPHIDINGQDYGLKWLEDITGVNTILATEVTINGCIKILHGDLLLEGKDFADIVAKIFNVPCNTLEDIARICHLLRVFLSEGIANSGNLTDKIHSLTDSWNANGKIQPFFKRLATVLDKQNKYKGFFGWFAEKYDRYLFEKGLKILVEKIKSKEYNDNRVLNQRIRDYYNFFKTDIKTVICGHTHMVESSRCHVTETYGGIDRDVQIRVDIYNTGTGTHIALIDDSNVMLEEI